MFNSLFDALFDYLFAEIVKVLSDFLEQMNGMGAELLELPWIQVLLIFFRQFGMALFLAGFAVAIFDCAIEAQNGRPAVRDLCLNLLKGFLAANLFTTVPIALFKACVSLQGELTRAVCAAFQIAAFEGLGTLSIQAITVFAGEVLITSLFFIIMVGYCVIKVFFQNVKRGGILLINIAVGSLYMLSLPRGMADGFTGWCRQIAALCLTTVLQTTMLTAGLLTCLEHPLLGVGLMLSANEVPRIAERFGVDTSVRFNFMSSYYAVNTAVNMVKGISKAAGR